MEIEYKGANCVVIRAKGSLIVVDPTANVKSREATNKDAITIATQAEFVPDAAAFVVDMPGEYEIGQVSARGIPARRHIDPEDAGQQATIYRLDVAGLRLAVVGHVNAPLSDDDLETIGVVAIAIVPVGGGGYTLDARDAATIARQLSPRIVIPTHYVDSAIKYEVPQESVELFIKEMGGFHEKVASLKVKNGTLPEALTVYEITRSA
jgi:L-ascorbate metabolism protein UlaG (beta-lactamase superfamily)